MIEHEQIQIDKSKKINDANLEFYQNIDVGRFKEFAEIIGLKNGIDIRKIYPEVANAEVIVEIGSGYGRAIDALIRQNFSKKIYGVERVAHLVSFLKHKFAEHKNIQIIHDDVKQLFLPEKADCILWIWSGILELSLPEQQETLSKLRLQLKEGGKIILETPHKEVKFIGEKSADNYIRFETDWGKIEAYLSTYEELKMISKEAGFKYTNRKLYSTESNLTRVFYILHA
ncbi:MAG: class I SAM-dependent methyltransferase [Bacteroidota bacterium]